MIGALALYWLGYALGEDRLKRWLDHIPLVDSDDLDTADRWFERHEKSAVLFGRCAPVVRSLMSIPAGANHMKLGLFTLLTTIGSGVWNAIFVGGGYALGSRWQDSSSTASWFDYAIYAFFARRHHQLGDQEGAQTAARVRGHLRSANARRSGVGQKPALIRVNSQSGWAMPLQLETTPPPAQPRSRLTAQKVNRARLCVLA